ncbi:hypothetical protein E4U21_006599 [Claviceps maximensis]|nr:hypothetical protein E4U21_006599 [Claviceps maximensis]
MNISAVLLLAISGLALAVEQNDPIVRNAQIPQKDNRNLRYVNDLPVPMDS